MLSSKFLLHALWVIASVHLSCTSINSSNDITIKIILPNAKVKQMAGQYLYLYNAPSNHLVDSVLVKTETVIFNLKADSAFVPHMVWIKQNDTFQSQTYKRPIGFKNPYKEKTMYCTFYIEKGLTIIKPSDTKDSTIISSFSGSKQNEVYFKDINLNFTSDEKDSTRKEAIINRNISIIKSYPYSIHLLSELYFYKEHFFDTDLKKQLSYFDNDIKNTSMFKSFTGYFAISSTYDKVYPEKLKLLDTKNSYQIIGDINAQYNLIVFWASWCGPCRAEIPELKELHKKYSEKGLYITSVSIDSDKSSWMNALTQEKMPWKQLLVDDSARDLLAQQYNIKTIPKIYLFDKNKQPVVVYEGNRSILTSKIDMLLK